MNRSRAIEMAVAHYESGGFLETLSRRVKLKTESQEETRSPVLLAYLEEEIIPELQCYGFACRIVENPAGGGSPFLLAERIEKNAAFTVLTYAHGDVVRGYDSQWRKGLSPWELTVEGDRIYGRGTADNKGQHTINLAALAQVLAARKSVLGYNIKLVMEMGEEINSPGLRLVCEQYRSHLAADVFIASDGPRLSVNKPTLFLGSRGAFNFDLRIKTREGSHHSGNWGGLLSNPGVRLANAIASMIGPQGQVLVKALLPTDIPDSVKKAIGRIVLEPSEGDPVIEPFWGEPGLSPTEKVFGWNTVEVLAFKTGNPDAPVNAIPGHAYAHCQIRFVVGSESGEFLRHIRAHLDAHGYSDVELKPSGEVMHATRLDPDDPWVRWCMRSIQRSTDKVPALLPNIGGSLPNDVFADVLQLPTLWIPHSYPGCSQHAPNEHMIASVAKEALRLMAGLFWDLAEEGGRVKAERSSAQGLPAHE